MNAASNEIGARSTGAAYPLPLRDGLEDNLRFDLVAAVKQWRVYFTNVYPTGISRTFSNLVGPNL